MFKIIQWDHSSIYGNTLHTRRKGKSETNQQDYAYINIPSDKIRKLYQAKGCKYSKIKRFVTTNLKLFIVHIRYIRCKRIFDGQYRRGRHRQGRHRQGRHRRGRHRQGRHRRGRHRRGRHRRGRHRR